MKVICPKCEKSIAASYTNKSKGLTYCNYCSDYFVLDDHLRRIPYHIKREEKFINTLKPPKSKIEVKETHQGFTIKVPDGYPAIVRFFLMIFLGAIVYAIYQIITAPQIINLDFYLKIGILILFGLLLILAIVIKAPKTILTISNDKVQLKRKRYIFSPYFRNRKTNNLDTIDTYYTSDHENGSSSGIKMTFDNDASLEFGHNLSTDEQDWLAGQLIQIRDALTLDHKVTKETEINLSRAKNNLIVVNTTKPTQSDFQFSDKSNNFTLIIPKDGKIGNALGTLIGYLIGISIFGTVAIGYWGFLPPFEYHKILKYVFSVFTLLAVYGLFYYLYTFIYRAEHRVFISPSEIRIELKPFGILHAKDRPTKALTDITSSREWNCILLKFKGYRDLRVGFSLTKDELKFLIGELKRSTKEVNSAATLNS